LRSARPGCRGLTLIEVLLTGALFAMVLFMVGDLMVLACRANDRAGRQVTEARSATATLDTLSRELRACTALLWPNPGAWAMESPYSPEKGKQEPLVFRFNTTAGESVAMYWIDADAGTVCRLLLKSTFVLGRPTTYLAQPGEAGGGRRMAFSVKSFEIWRTDTSKTGGLPFIEARLKLRSVADPLTISARVISL